MSARGVAWGRSPEVRAEAGDGGAGPEQGGPIDLTFLPPRLPGLDPTATALRATYVRSSEGREGPPQRENLVLQREVVPDGDIAALARQALASLLHTMPGLRGVERGSIVFRDRTIGRYLAYGLDPAGVPLAQVHALRVDAEPARFVLTTAVWTLPYGAPTALLLEQLATTLKHGAAR